MTEMTEELTDELLPEEIVAELEKRKAAKLERIQAMATSIIKKRDAAVAYRASSGIEDDWLEDEEFYQGIDDANRDQVKELKPATTSGSIVGRRNQSQTRSTVFLNITRPYVDAAAARVSDMLLPNDDRNWSFDPTPVPELEMGKTDGRPVPGAMVPQMAEQGPGLEPVSTGAMVQATVRDLVEQRMAEARKKAEAAQRRVDDWLVQGRYSAEMRKVIRDAARLGTGVLKGPSPVKRKSKKVSVVDGALVLQLLESLDPESKSISPWNCYPDPACGDDIHNGSFFFEWDRLTVRQVRDLDGLPGYDSEALALCLEEGPQKSGLSTTRPKGASLGDDERFDVWYFYGFLDKDDLEAMGCDCEGQPLSSVPAFVTLINDRPVKAVLNPLDSGRFPYDMLPWQERCDSPFGSGVARQVRTPQRMLNAATRNMMDNAGLSNGPQLVIRDKAIVPVDGTWELVPRKIWKVSADFEGKSVSDAITSINIVALQNELQNIINFALKMAEDITGLPMLLQGQQGQAPDTVGGMQMLQNNAGAVLRALAKSFDDRITTPHMQAYYEWLMTYGESEEEKGDFQIVAHGSSTLVERDLQNQAILQMGNFVLNPAFELSPSRWIREAIKAQKMDPSRFEMTDEEKKRASQRQAPPAPQVQAAQIRAQAQLQSAQLDAEVEMQKAQIDADRETIYVQAENDRTQLEHEARMQELYVKRELAMLEYANQNKTTLDKIKADLAKESMRLTTQKELAGVTAALKAPQVARPAIEPPGRAPDGQAFQR